MTKIDGRSKKEAARQLDESLRRLQTDRIDLVQHHEVHPLRGSRTGSSTRKAPTRRCVEARQAGKLRYIGFTGHKDPRIHLHMLEVADEHGFRFDTVQMPLNVMDAHYRSFEKLVLPELVETADRRARHEEHGQRHHPQVEDRDARSNACITR